MSQRRSGYESLLLAETDAVLADTVFRRSPVLSKLLRYLADKTAEGKADALKSYAVAVDCLGRPENFDAASDSSARVQMVRLRKALETHYAQHAPIEEQCLSLQPGSYKLRLGRLAVAYPMLYRPLAQLQPDIRPGSPPPLDYISGGEDRVDRGPAKSISNRRHLAIPVVIFLIVVLSVIAWLQPNIVRQTQLSPVLEVMPVDRGDNPQLDQAARIVSTSLTNDLPRFKLARIRVVSEGAPRDQVDGQTEFYRLFSRIEDNGAGNRMLFLTIDDARTNTTLWSQQIPLPDDSATTSQAMSSVAAEINGPFGVIATNGLQLHETDASGGYPCLLKYFEFMRARELQLEAKVADCLGRPVRETRMEATILAARAMFAIERSSARDDFPAAAQSANAYARQAVGVDPNDGAANYVLARLSYLRRDCVVARYYTTRAITLNPKSPVITANLAALAPICAHPDAASLLDQAFLSQSPRYPNGRLLLALAAISQNRLDRISEIKDSDPPQSRYNWVNYHLTEALIAASRGRRTDAASNWRAFAKLVPPENGTPDEKLRSIVVILQARQRLVNYLAKAGAFNAS